MRRFLTSLAFSLNAFAFGAITCAAFVASYGHTQLGNVNAAASVLGIGFFTLFVMIVSALPTAQRNLIGLMDGPVGRFVGRFGALLLVLFAFAIASVTVLRRPEPLFGVIGTGHVLLAFLIYAILMVLAFVVPGLAYPRRERPAPAPAVEVYSPRAMSATRVPEAGRPRVAEAPVARERLTVRIVREVVGVFLLVPAIAALYGSGWAWFLPSPAHVAWAEGRAGVVLLVALPLYVACALLCPLGEPRGPLGGFMRRHRWLKRPLFVLIMTAFSFAIPFALERGLPALHSFAVNAPVVTAEVVVVERGRLTRGKMCDRTVEVAFPGAEATAGNLCEVPRDIWDAVEPGDRLILTGYWTAFGFRYESVARP
jgi:hypothetical protein